MNIGFETGAGVEIWALVAVNFLGVALGALITGISYFAYRSNRQKKSLRRATHGFGLITIGIAVEPAYQLGTSGPHALASEKIITLQLLEGLLISLGFLVLFLSLYKYESEPSRQTITVSGIDDELFEDPE